MIGLRIYCLRFFCKLYRYALVRSFISVESACGGLAGMGAAGGEYPFRQSAIDFQSSFHIINFEIGCFVS